MIQELDRVVHQWCFDNDRWMYIEYDRDGEVMGLNFMQGDDYEYFLKGGWCKSDPGLTEFYRQMLYTFPIELKSVSTLTLTITLKSAQEVALYTKRIRQTLDNIIESKI